MRAFSLTLCSAVAAYLCLSVHLTRAYPPPRPIGQTSKDASIDQWSRLPDEASDGYSSDTDIDDKFSVSACAGRLRGKCTPARLAKFFVPKPASYHRQKMGLHAKNAALYAAAAPTAVGLHTTSGAIGGCASFHMALGKCIAGDASAVTDLISAPVRPVVGAGAGVTYGAAHAIDAVTQTAGVVYHGVQYPIAKCRDLLVGCPSKSTAKKYDKKARTYKVKQDKIDCRIMDSHINCATSLLGLQ